MVLELIPAVDYTLNFDMVCAFDGFVVDTHEFRETVSPLMYKRCLLGACFFLQSHCFYIEPFRTPPLVYSFLQSRSCVSVVHWRMR